MFLGARGIRCLIVERHHGSSLHPRARGFTQRTVEMFDTAGLKGCLPEVPASMTQPRRVRTASMVAVPMEEMHWTPASAARLHALVDHAHSLGYWIRFYTLDGFAAADNEGWGTMESRP